MKLSQSLLVVLVPVMASGCYGSSESYNQEVASIACNSLQECNKAQFESAYSSMSDCVDTQSEDAIDVTSTCEYDADQGRECIKAIKKYKNQCDLNLAELEEIATACTDVHYSCGAGFTYDPALRQMSISVDGE